MTNSSEAVTGDSNVDGTTKLRRKSHWSIRLLKRIIFAGGFLYLAFLFLLVCLETRLVYPGAREGNWNPIGISYEPLWLNSKDGTKINAWYLPVDGQSNAALVMSHGNAENIATMIGEADSYRRRYNMPVMIYDYRGFGQSEGVPYEAGVLEDAETAHEWLANKTNLPSTKIFQFGRSLGGGVAVHLAAKYGAAGLILDRTYNSVVDVAAARYWMMPIRLVIRNRYPSDTKVANYHGPLLQLHGDQDEVIPLPFAKKLFAAAVSPDKTFVESPGTTHLDPWPSAFKNATSQFLERLLPQ